MVKIPKWPRPAKKATVGSILPSLGPLGCNGHGLWCLAVTTVVSISLCLLTNCTASSQEVDLSRFAQGWDPNRGPTEAKILESKLPKFYKAQIQSLLATSDDSDALNFRFLAQCLKVQRVQGMNQGQLGSCVGFGTAHALEIIGAADIVHRRQREAWVTRPSGGGLYALGRTHARQLGSWEGSTGSWSVSAMQEVGTLWLKPYGSVDLTRYDIGIIKRWQQSGVPRELIEAAKEHPVVGCYLLKNTAELKALLQNGYAAIICSQSSYSSQSDRMGFCRRTGREWAHCMAVVSYRGPSSGREGFLVQNSWGDYIKGGIWPEDQPVGSFWATPADVQFSLDQGDSWAIGDVKGFPAKELTWKEALSVGGNEKSERSWSLAN